MAMSNLSQANVVGGATRLPGIDVDFTLAIHNRTGKYFIGRELIDGMPELIGNIYYGPISLAKAPGRWMGKLLGRIQHIQTRSRVMQGVWPLPRRQPRHPMLHLDPFTVGSTALSRADVVLCHDIGPITHPELFEPGVCQAYRAIYDEIARVQPNMVFVSRASRRAFHEFYPASAPARSQVIYPAIRPVRAGAISPPPGCENGPFLLTVGSIGDRKNQLACVNAFARSGLAERGVTYILCGAREPGFDAVARAAEETAGVRLLPYISDPELAWLYAHASGFVLASRLEGFGMPVAEAIGHGLVPAVTRGTALHEVAGEASLLVDADDEASIASAMIRLVEMQSAERSTRLEELLRSLDRFTSERFLEQWRALLRRILLFECGAGGTTLAG